MNGHDRIFPHFAFYGNTVFRTELILQTLMYIADTDLPEKVC